MSFQSIPFSKLSYDQKDQQLLGKIIDDKTQCLIYQGLGNPQTFKDSKLCKSFVKNFGQETLRADSYATQLATFLSCVGFSAQEFRGKFKSNLGQTINMVFNGQAIAKVDSPLMNTLNEIASTMSGQYAKILGYNKQSQAFIQYKTKYPDRDFKNINLTQIIEEGFEDKRKQQQNTITGLTSNTKEQPIQQRLNITQKLEQIKNITSQLERIRVALNNQMSLL